MDKTDKKEKMDKQEKELKGACSLLWDEIKKDFLLFGFFGFIIIWLFVFMDKLKQWGISYAEDSLQLELFESFMSLNVLFFLMMSLIIVATIANTLSGLGWQCSKLEGAVRHIGLRYIQITSTIISFCGGVAVAALLNSIFTISWDGVKLAGVAILSSGVIFVWSIFPNIFILKYRPWDEWWTNLSMAVISTFVLLPLPFLFPKFYENLWLSVIILLFGLWALYHSIRRDYFHKKA